MKGISIVFLSKYLFFLDGIPVWCLMPIKCEVYTHELNTLVHVLNINMKFIFSDTIISRISSVMLIFFEEFDAKFVQKCASNILKTNLQLKKFYPKTILISRDFL